MNSLTGRLLRRAFALGCSLGLQVYRLTYHRASHRGISFFYAPDSSGRERFQQALDLIARSSPELLEWVAENALTIELNDRSSYDSWAAALCIDVRPERSPLEIACLVHEVAHASYFQTDLHREQLERHAFREEAAFGQMLRHRVERERKRARRLERQGMPVPEQLLSAEDCETLERRPADYENVAARHAHWKADDRVARTLKDLKERGVSPSGIRAVRRLGEWLTALERPPQALSPTQLFSRGRSGHQS